MQTPGFWRLNSLRRFNCYCDYENVRMQRSSLKGPFFLHDEDIDREVEPDRPGVFLLGGSGVFSLSDARVGRSDTNLNNQLHVYVGSYRYFSFQYCSSAQESFEAECDLFHDVKPHDNSVHPARITGTEWKCPRCKLFG